MTLFTKFVKELMYNKLYIFADYLHNTTKQTQQHIEQGEDVEGWEHAKISQLLAFQMKALTQHKRLILWDRVGKTNIYFQHLEKLTEVGFLNEAITSGKSMKADVKKRLRRDSG